MARSANQVRECVDVEKHDLEATAAARKRFCQRISRKLIEVRIKEKCGVLKEMCVCVKGEKERERERNNSDEAIAHQLNVYKSLGIGTCIKGYTYAHFIFSLIRMWMIAALQDGDETHGLTIRDC